MAELKKEDLPSDTAATGDPCSTLSESQYTCTQVVTVVLLYTGIDDLLAVQMCLESVVRWKKLGLALGLLYPTLQKIEIAKRENVDNCMTEMLAAWLQQQDHVSRKGIPSWTVLRTALEEIGEHQLASDIST